MAGTGILAAVFVSAAVSWACSFAPYIPPGSGGVSPNRGAEGTVARVSGRAFRPGPIDVRWNATDGPVLATTEGPEFSVQVTIPSARPGVYSIVAVQVGTGKASAPFEVTASNTTVPSGSGGGGSEATVTESETSAPAEASEPAQSGQAARSTAPARSGSSAAASIQAEPGSTPAEPVSSGVATNPSSAGSGPTGTTETTKASASSTGRSAAGVANPQPSSSGVSAAPAQAAPVTGVDTEPAQAPSPASVTADLWGGFSAVGPGLYATPGAATVGTGGSGSSAELGVALLGAGLVALFAGFAGAELRRRRVVAQPSNSR